MTDEEKAIHEAYEKAWAGEHKPTAGWISCPVCEKTFMITKYGDTKVKFNKVEVCSHILAELAKLPNPRVQ